jgi:cell division septum initiation protein DivIVA
MPVYDQIKKAFQDIVAPEIKAVQVEVKRLDERIGSVRNEIGSLRNEMMSEFKRVDSRIDALAAELKTAIDIRERLAALEAKIGAS